ncbi:hypothetical protein XAC3218_360131 [Xanthomonas citri pv. citri]|nr:hypothetical protein XAC3218_360131 [Xanthomonas citri pv. citri]CEI16742.1 hypothetical protein XACG115_750055 [Xanthomonas citri pv. citri]
MRLLRIASSTSDVTDEFTPAAAIRAGVPSQGVRRGGNREAQPRNYVRLVRTSRKNPHIHVRTLQKVRAAHGDSALTELLQCPKSPCVRCWKPASISATRPATGTPRWRRTSSARAARSTSSTSRRPFRSSTTR